MEEGVVSKSLTFFFRNIFQRKRNLNCSVTAGQEIGSDQLWNISYFRLTRHRSESLPGTSGSKLRDKNMESPLGARDTTRVPSHSETPCHSQGSGRCPLLKAFGRLLRVCCQSLMNLKCDHIVTATRRFTE